jgi:hypothetical protein
MRLQNWLSGAAKADDAQWCRERAEQLRVALEANAWDGACAQGIF